MSKKKIDFVQEKAAEYNVRENTLISQYIKKKTKASDRNSKARKSLGNLYALYVICEDYVNDLEGSSFTELMRRMKGMPFGAKLQNHPLDNRLNDEVRRLINSLEKQYEAPSEMLPVQPANLENQKKARKISTALLSEGGMNPKHTAQFVVSAVDEYIRIIEENQTEFLNEISNATTDEELVYLIKKGFEYNSDARLFEIISFALLHLHYRGIKVKLTIDGQLYEEELHLYKTGRTNANDGGIDFVLKPLGKFFQVTETLDFKKYFLDFDKVNRYSMSFVIKTELSIAEVRSRIKEDSRNEFGGDLSDKYIQLFDDIFTVNELQNILEQVITSKESINELKNIVIDCFKLEYGLLD